MESDSQICFAFKSKILSGVLPCANSFADSVVVEGLKINLVIGQRSCCKFEEKPIFLYASDLVVADAS